jgi:hypothetical protein
VSTWKKNKISQNSWNEIGMRYKGINNMELIEREEWGSKIKL